MPSESKKIRILFITSNLGIGGLEQVIVQICTHIDKKIFEPAVCCLHFKGDLAKQLESLGVRVYLAGVIKPDYMAFLKILPIIKKFKPQIVHTHNINASIDGIIASVLKQLPVIIHTDHARKFPDKQHYMFIERLLSRFVSKIIAVSEETRRNLIYYEKIKESKLKVVTNGVGRLEVNVANVLKIKEELGIKANSLVIGTAVRLEKQKGLIHLIKAVPSILEKYPDITVVIAGRGSQREFLIDEVKKAGLLQTVKFIGPRLDIADFLGMLDIYVLPSEWEGLPMSLLEAMCCKRAIVASRVGGIPGAITDGVHGILVSPGSHEELSSQICRLIKDELLREKLGEAAKSRFEEKFTVERMVQEHQNIYLEFLNKKGIVYADTGA